MVGWKEPNQGFLGRESRRASPTERCLESLVERPALSLQGGASSAAPRGRQSECEVLATLSLLQRRVMPEPSIGSHRSPSDAESARKVYAVRTTSPATLFGSLASVRRARTATGSSLLRFLPEAILLPRPSCRTRRSTLSGNLQSFSTSRSGHLEDETTNAIVWIKNL
jgi:hypothetical protein